MQKLNIQTIIFYKGAFINDVTHLGGEGVSIFVTKCDRRVRGVDSNVMSHLGVYILTFS